MIDMIKAIDKRAVISDIRVTAKSGGRSGDWRRDDGTGHTPVTATVGTALVITVSTRAHAGVYADESGPMVSAALVEAGFVTDGPQIVPDGKAVGWALQDGIDARLRRDHHHRRNRSDARRRDPGADQTLAGQGHPAPGRGDRSRTAWPRACRRPCSAVASPA